MQAPYTYLPLPSPPLVVYYLKSRLIPCLITPHMQSIRLRPDGGRAVRRTGEGQHGRVQEVLHCTILCCTVLHCTVQYSTVLLWLLMRCAVFYCILMSCHVMYCSALYCTVMWRYALHCILLHCTVLQCSALPWDLVVYHRVVTLPTISPVKDTPYEHWSQHSL